MKNFNDLTQKFKEEDLGAYIAAELVGRIMAERDRRNISQRELSRISGVPQKTISKIEGGLDIPKLITLGKLLSALDLDMEVTIKRKNDER